MSIEEKTSYDKVGVALLIPALNEEHTLGDVVRSVVKQVDIVVVADNGSKDRTAEIAKQAGAVVVSEPQRGYGYACLKALQYLEDHAIPDSVVFMDGDGSDDPDDLIKLIELVRDKDVDLALASRVAGQHEPGALSVTQRFGNGLSCLLTWVFFGVRYTDLGPFRAMKWTSLKQLKMSDKTYGWTIEMQVKAARYGMKIHEIPTNYRRRAGGKSKVSGSIRGIYGAGTKILGLIFIQAIDALLHGRQPRSHA